MHHELTAEAIRLTRVGRSLLPNDGEVAGLLALMLLTEARRAQPRRCGRGARRRRGGPWPSSTASNPNWPAQVTPEDTWP
ncbi:hypothetical protein BA895_20275 [Humibacillus sp. DSM 29435]|uniref:DUF6596 domain-containing protein n=1 Tax=Humibacillus sp. DSM 29435 TaxID=1869167 RepID=UPI0008727F2B|nr:hypothetical protein BA895_20275 [Humibacillus sp. DSM 29435]